MDYEKIMDERQNTSMNTFLLIVILEIQIELNGCWTG